MIQARPVLGSQRQHPQNEVLGIWRRTREGAAIKSPPTHAMAGGSNVDNQGCYGCHTEETSRGGGRVGMSNMGEVCCRPPLDTWLKWQCTWSCSVLRCCCHCSMQSRHPCLTVKMHCVANTLPSPCFLASLPFHPSLPPLCSVMGQNLEGPCGCLIKAQSNLRCNLKVLKWASRAPG